MALNPGRQDGAGPGDQSRGALAAHLPGGVGGRGGASTNQGAEPGA